MAPLGLQRPSRGGRWRIHRKAQDLRRGRLKTRKIRDKDSGKDVYVTEIMADQMQMLGERRHGDDNDNRAQRETHRPPRDQTVSRVASRSGLSASRSEPAARTATLGSAAWTTTSRSKPEDRAVKEQASPTKG